MPRPTAGEASARSCRCASRWCYSSRSGSRDPELRTAHAARIFANRNRSGAYAMMFCIGTAVFSMFFFLTQFLQNVLRLESDQDRRRASCP